MNFDINDKDKTNSIEILAPAGSLESLKSAVNCGADAVYLGGQKFSARKNAQNFTDEELLEGINYAHLRGAKVHVAVNTLMHESELNDVFNYLKFLNDISCDAVIVQDLGVLNIIKEYFPKMEIHASTQMTIHNLEGALRAKELGFKRAVLSRELSLNEISYISKNAGIETEVFAHGALCMSYSGQCLLSSMLGGRSGNRGYCAQPCRLSYTLLNDKKQQISEDSRYLLSLKDMCLLDEIDKLQNANVTSLKIEGRMKGENYSALTSYLYSKAKNNGDDKTADIDMLRDIFSRNGFTKGYFNSSYGRHMLNYSSNCDDIYKNQSDEVLKFADSLIKTNEVKRCVSGIFYGELDKPLSLEISLDGIKVKAFSNVCPQRAIKTPTSEERIINQLNKTGGLPFEFSDLKIFADKDINIPIKAINELRRDAFLKLEDEILKPKDKKTDMVYNYKKSTPKAQKSVFTCEVLNISQAKCAKDLGFRRIYIPYSVYNEQKDYFNKHPDIFYLMLSPIERDKFRLDLDKVNLKNICASNISQITDCGNLNIHANYTLNIYNSRSQNELKAMGVGSLCLSPELNFKEIKEALTDIDTEIIVYGKIALMTVQNCIVKSALGECDKNCKNSFYYLKDRKNMHFPIFTQRGQCTNVLYNSLPIYMGDKMDELLKLGTKYLRFIFTTENSDDITKIVKMYQNRVSFFNNEYTRGHFMRGVF